MLNKIYVLRIEQKYYARTRQKYPEFEKKQGKQMVKSQHYARIR